MLRPVSFLPALVVVLATLAAPPVAAEPDPDGREPVLSRSQARSAQGAPRAPAEEGSPLEVRISSLSPSSVPRQGPIRVSGAVTNTSDDLWQSVKVYAFAADAPITATPELAEQRLLDADALVGDRITDPGTFDSVGDLAPGNTAQFSFKVPRSALPLAGPGVYWFGAHALGGGPEGRDLVADGRARTFLPFVPPTRRTLDTALVVPVRHDIRYAEDGALADVEGWASTLEDGPLRTLVDFGASAGSRPLTWLVDPAVPDAVRRLVAGNPARSLDDTVEPPPTGEDTDAGDAGGPDPTGQPDPTSSATADPEPDTADNPAGAAGEAWLDRFREAVTGNEVLALPYGDIDVSAATQWSPETYDRARRRSGTELAPFGFPSSPAVAAPDGYLDPGSIGSIHPHATVLVTDKMFGPRARSVTQVSGRRLVVTSSVGAGGPGPGDPLTAVALRQQILSEAAIRLLNPGRKPLVVTLPDDWAPEGTTGFFEGLDLPWLNLTDVSGLGARAGREVLSGRLDYPERQTRRELDAANFTAAEGLSAAGETLQNVLTRNDQIAAAIHDEALAGLSYASRTHPNSSRASADRSRRWIQERLGDVVVTAPPAVTLSSSAGRFSATLTNELDHAVTVRVEAIVDAPLEISGPESIEIPADSSTSVLLDASSAQLGVSNVQLVVTDVTGTPLGSSQSLPVRSVQVSQVIWVIIGTGVALLFGAIAVRQVRRVRRGRAG